jgi:hypothetical protein
MRTTYALLVGASLTLAPAVALARTPQVTYERAASEPAAPPPTNPQPTAPRPPPPVPTPPQPTVSQPSPAGDAPDVSARLDDQGEKKLSREELARYEVKDANSPGAKQYRGGDTLVIGAGAATLVLAIVLLIVLL